MDNDKTKFNSSVDRDRFGSQIPINSRLTDNYLDRYGYIIDFGGEELVTISTDEKYYYIVSVPKTDIKHRPLYFTAMTDKEVEVISNKFSAIKEKRLIGKTLVFDVEKYIKDIESKDKFKRVNKLLDNFQLHEDYDLEKIKEFYAKWMEWRMVRKGQDDHIEQKELDEILYLLENKAKYDTKAIFIEQEGHLIAFAVGCRYSKEQNIYINSGAHGLDEPRNITLLAKYLRAKQYPKDAEIFDFVFTNDINLTESKTEISQPKHNLNHYSVAVA